MKKISAILASFLVAFSLTGCNQAKTPEKAEKAPIVNVGALKGPTAMGMSSLIDKNFKEKPKKYDFTIGNSVDDIVPEIVSKKLDIAAVPSNVASILYNKTNGNVQVIAINTLGVLYLVQNGGEPIKSPQDLNGKTIFTSGKGATPEYVIEYLLQGAKKLNNDKDINVNVDFKAEHQEALAALLKTEGGLAVLPQPFVTVAQTKAKNLKTVMDLTKAWDEVAKANNEKSTLITGVCVVRKDFAEKYPEAVKNFMKEYKESIEFTNKNVDQAAKIIGSLDIVPEPIAKKAIPQCNIKFIDGKDMQESLSGYLKVLHGFNPKSVGGKLPGDDFYYLP